MNGYPPPPADWSPPAADSTRVPSLYEHPDFQSIRGAFRAFAAVAVTLVVGGFLLYVLLSSFAPGVMNQRLAGHLTVGLALGLAQFAVMALAVWRYTVHMSRRVDPAARRLRTELERADARGTSDRQPRGFGTW
ncbi:DUF485 domain-containing protein [Streptomyces sp. NPDC003758]|uniref:DUF485 domain-containing protein n=1 Tax=Streptomyces cynarae TaxID=2981134 RepID=A0ABY6DXU9_9ACTN|nr:DUF485 domain-containing protein [Streptomyces cynarae]UXY18533.1 DUF485 domain-containing protein [Streptomyces cynarae]